MMTWDTSMAWLAVVVVALAGLWRWLHGAMDVCGRCARTWTRSEMLDHPMQGPLCPSCSRDQGITDKSLREYRRRVQ